jgi:hypothetical protein
MADPRVTTGLRYSPLAALVAIVLYALTQSSETDKLEVFSVGSIVFAAAFGIGAVVGFLFGIPRRLQQDAAASPVGQSLAVNTNLEQVSDWLTKIIVGIGLVQIGELADGLDSVAESVALGDQASAESFALGLLVYSLVDGFLLAYVWTRLELSAQIALADARLGPPLPPPPPLPPAPPQVAPAPAAPAQPPAAPDPGENPE